MNSIAVVWMATSVRFLASEERPIYNFIGEPIFLLFPFLFILEALEINGSFIFFVKNGIYNLIITKNVWQLRASVV